MKLTYIAKCIICLVRRMINWITDLFNFTRMSQPKQLIPIKIDSKKPPRPYSHHDYDNNVLKMMLIIVTSLLLMLLFGKLTFE